MRPILKLLVVLGLALILTPLASAQVTSAQVGAFGTQTRVGDDDYTPLLKASKTWAIAEFDAGIPGDVTDNCIALIYDAHPSLAGAAPQTVRLLNKDIRLTPCQGKPAGSLLGDVDVVEKATTYMAYGASGAAATTLNAQTITGTASAANKFSFAYADVDSSGKYNKGDSLYLTVGTPSAGNLLVATTGTGSWTIRMTPAGAYPAGSFVFAGDTDFVSYAKSGPSKNNKAWIVDEREDKGWYLMTTDSLCCLNAVPATATSTILAGTPLPVNAIRLGVRDTFSLQPSIIVTGAELANADAAEAGKPLPVIVTITNNGAAAGYGVLVTKLDKQIVDVRMSPLLSPGESTKTIVTVAKVPYGGQQELEVNDVFVPIAVKGPAAASAPTAGGVTAAEVQDLKDRVAALEASRTSVSKQGSPGIAPVASLGALVAVALVLRRRQG